LLTTAALLLFGFAGTTEAQLVLYDDFTGPRIDPARWFAPGEITDGRFAPNEETSRAIASGSLRQSLTTYGGTEGDVDVFGIGRQRLRFFDGTGLTTIQATVNVNSVTVETCAANPNSTRASAQIAGTFFNDGTPDPKNREGNILAAFGKFRDSRLGRRFEAFVFRCDPADCDNVVASHVFASTWTNGSVHTLRLEWDAAADLFRFTIDPGGPGEEIAELPYAFSDTTPLIGPDFKELRVENAVAECTAGQKRSSISALFDDVMVSP